MRNVQALSLLTATRTAPYRLPRWQSRLLAHVGGPWLDRQLAAGAASWRSPSHAARALQLTSARRRRALARSLEWLIDGSDHGKVPFASATIAPCREQVHQARPEILAIASRLRSDAPVNVRGIAALGELLGDGGGPCYSRIRPDALVLALHEVSEWLAIND